MGEPGSGKTYVVLGGTGVCNDEKWGRLEAVARDLEAFKEYALGSFPRAEIVEVPSSTAAEVRDGLSRAFDQPKSDDDLILVWAGHGTGEYLAVQETPHPDNGGISTTNTLKVIELEPWVRTCQARSIVIIIDVCRSGNSSKKLIGDIWDKLETESPSKKAERHCEIVTSARNENAEDGRFMSAVLATLREPPRGRNWPPGTIKLSPSQLVGEVNERLNGQQAQGHTVYGNLGAFFPLVRHAAGEELPADARKALERDFADELADRPVATWDVDGLRDAAAQWAEKSPFLAGRLEQEAIALSAQILVIGWVGGQAQLTRHHDRAWRAEFPADPERPTTLFGSFVGVARRRPSGEDHRDMVRYVARILHLADHEPEDERLFEWAKKWGVDHEQVSEAIATAKRTEVPARLVIDLAEDCGGREPDAPAVRAVGWLRVDTDGDIQIGEKIEVQLDGETDATAAVAEVCEMAARSVGTLDHVDVVLACAQLATVDPLRVEVVRNREFGISEALAIMATVTVRSGDRCYRNGYRRPSLDTPRTAPTWIDPADDPAAQYEALRNTEGPIGIKAKPADLRIWGVLLLDHSQLVWHRSDLHTPDHEEAVAAAWGDSFAGRVVSAARDGTPTGLEATGLVWDDDAWSRLWDDLDHHRASFGSSERPAVPEGRML
ncbi:MAG: hypothetical protein ACK5PP_19190 [Acidimicrobiales bacterium]